MNWNTFTWYPKAAAVILFVFFVCSAFFLGRWYQKQITITTPPVQAPNTSTNQNFRKSAKIDRDSLSTTSPNPVISGTATDLSSVAVGISNMNLGPHSCGLGDYFYDKNVPVVGGRWSVKVVREDGSGLVPCDTYEVYVQTVSGETATTAQVTVFDDENLVVKKAD